MDAIKDGSLTDLSALADLDDGPFSEVVKATILTLTQERANCESALEEILRPLGPLRGKQAYAALTSSLLEAARTDASPEQLKSTAEDAGLGPEQCKLLGSAYEQKKAKLRDVLGRIDEIYNLTALKHKYSLTLLFMLISKGLAHVWTTGGYGALDLVGLDWRLDYHVKSSVTGNDNEPVSYVTFRTLDKDGRPQDVKLACSLEELQDLRAKVKDAVKQADRVLTGGFLDN